MSSGSDMLQGVTRSRNDSEEASSLPTVLLRVVGCGRGRVVGLPMLKGRRLRFRCGSEGRNARVLRITSKQMRTPPNTIPKSLSTRVFTAADEPYEAYGARRCQLRLDHPNVESNAGQAFVPINLFSPQAVICLEPLQRHQTPRLRRACVAPRRHLWRSMSVVDLAVAYSFACLRSARPASVGTDQVSSRYV